MDSTKLEQLFLLEVLIDRVCLHDETIGSAEEPLRVRVKFIDFPCFEINQQDFSPGSACPTSPGNFNSGKSCLFPMVPVDLIRNLQRYPLAVTVYQVKQDVPVPDIVGQTRVRMTEGVMEAVQTAMNCNCDTELPVTHTLKDTFSLVNIGGEVGTIVLFIRLSCFGQSIVTQFQMMGEKKAFLFKNSKDDKAYSCKKQDTIKDSEDPTKYDILLAKPFISTEETTFGCGCDEGNGDFEDSSVAWKMPASKPQCPSPCAVAAPVCPEHCDCPCSQLPEPCNHKLRPPPAFVGPTPSAPPFPSVDSCQCGFVDGDLTVNRPPWCGAECPYTGQMHQPAAPVWCDTRVVLCPAYQAGDVVQQPSESLTSSCKCDFGDDSDVTSGMVSSGGGTMSARPSCGEGDGSAACATPESAGNEAEGGVDEKKTRSTSYRNSDIATLPGTALSQQDSKKVSIVDMAQGKRTKKRKSNFTYKYGLQYPGIKCGHRCCVEPVCIVPPNMGWMWKARSNNACPGINRPRKGWRPGAVGFTISKMINEHRIAAGKAPNHIAQKRGFKSGRRTNADGGEAPQPPTLHIHRKDGAYYISMHPLNIGGDSEQVPLEFKIPKQQGYDGDSDSTESEMEIEFMAPGAFELKKEPPVFRSFGTQYLTKDVAHLLAEAKGSSLQLHKDKKPASVNHEEKNNKDGKKGGAGKGNKKKGATGTTSAGDMKVREEGTTTVGILASQKKKK